MSSTAPQPGGLAYKAYEIEELIDVYFFRRLGIVTAWAARAVSLTPNAVSVLAGVVGAAGGVLLLWERWQWLGVALLWAHGVFDSADGQLARLTGQTSEWGRVLDGVAGYVTHVAAYVAIVVRVTNEGGSGWVWTLGVAAGIATIVHAQLYDYHRTSYTGVVVRGRPGIQMTDLPAGRGLVGLYERTQRGLAGRHPRVETVVAGRARDGVVSEADRCRYRECFLPLMPGWNLFGDNMRRYGFALFTALGWLQGYFWYILLLNVPLVVMWRLQWRADARFLAGLADRSAGTADARA